MSEIDEEGILSLIFKQKEGYKFVMGIVVLFVLPQIINIYNTFVRNRSYKATLSRITKELARVNNNMNIVRDRVDLIFNDNLEEATLFQLEYAFRGRVSIDIDLLISNTKRVIVINHIEDKKATDIKIEAFVNNTYANTCLIMDGFKCNSKGGSVFMCEDWKAAIGKVIYDFIYSIEKESKDKRTYNFETLKHQLRGQFDTFIIEFINNINKDKI